MTPSEYDVCLLSLYTLGGLNWIGRQWPFNIPEVNSDKEDEDESGEASFEKHRGERCNKSTGDQSTGPPLVHQGLAPARAINSP